MAVLPSEADFPYTIRSVTEIMSQNGSLQWLQLCSSSLALMDAGVPIKSPVSGIAMGLMVEGNKQYILSDIADAEDLPVTWTLKLQERLRVLQRSRWT